VDPDDNFFNEIFPSLSREAQSQYYTLDRLNSVLNQASPSTLTVLNFNVRSFNANGEVFVSSLDSFKIYPDIIVLTETWLCAGNEDLCNIDGYNSFHTVRRNGRGGGVSVFCKSDIRCVKLENFSFGTGTIEVCTVRIDVGSSSIYLVAIYRPHSDTVTNFIEALEKIIQDQLLNRAKIVIAGDLNINLLNDSCGDVQNFIYTLQSLNFIPVVTKPTRFQGDGDSQSATLLDHIWTNNLVEYTSGIILYDLTDHCPTFMCFNCFREETSPHEKLKIAVRCHNSENVDRFLTALGQVEWSFDRLNLDCSVGNFLETVQSLYARCFPVNTKLISNKRLNKPWLTPGILKSIRTKSTYFKMFKAGVIDRQTNSRYRNKLTSLIRISKRNYYNKKCNDCGNDAKKMWSLINGLLSKRAGRKVAEKIIVNNIEVTNEIDIAEEFNKFFASIASELDDSIPRSNYSPLRSLVGNYPNSFFMSPATPDEVVKIIMNLKSRGKSGDVAPVFLWKKASHVLAPPIADLINLSFQSGVFPNSLKNSTVTPVYKAGIDTNVSNYRPISVLPTLSKIFEKCMCSRLMSYVEKRNIICPEQFGFQKGKGTVDAVLDFVGRIYRALDDRNHVVSMFVDLRKAFDTVNHAVLLDKLLFYGVRGLPLELIRSYLKDRKQIVKVKSMTSGPRIMNVGLPQGSILGPLMFLLYVNDLPAVSELFSCVMFADDTTLLSADHNYVNLIGRVNCELQKIVEWTNANRLSVNVDKTIAMLYSNRLASIDDDLVPVLNNKPVKFSSSVKFLGVTVDDKLKFSEHASNMCNKLSKVVGILYKLQPYLSEGSLISVYYGLAFPYLIYCNMVWGATFPTHTNSLFLLQKKIVRLITGSDRLAHTDPLFYRTAILKLSDLHTYLLCVHMFCRVHGNMAAGVTHSYNTRNRDYVVPSLNRLTLTQHSLTHAGPRAWNALPAELKEVGNLHIFKKRLKVYLISRYRQAV